MNFASFHRVNLAPRYGRKWLKIIAVIQLISSQATGILLSLLRNVAYISLGNSRMSHVGSVPQGFCLSLVKSGVSLYTQLDYSFSI